MSLQSSRGWDVVLGCPVPTDSVGRSNASVLFDDSSKPATSSLLLPNSSELF